MKKIYLFIIGILMVVLPMNVNASSASISVSASDTVMVGNTVTVTVKLSSSSKIGSWQADLSYDKSYLQLTSSSAEAGGTAMANVVANGTKSKTYTFKFKALKKGNPKVSVSSYALFDYDTMEKMSTTAGSKTISIKTKEEIEASYSSNANLKGITIGEYTLTPVFNKDTLEYEVEVPNEIESVNVSASKEDGTASITGTGDITLTEGNNKVTIVVTAQKGNSKTYVVNIYRKELDPISVSVGGKSFTVVRRSDALPEYVTFKQTTTTIDGEEVPALYSEITGYTLIGLKDDAGEVRMYLVENGKATLEYVEVKSNAINLYPLKLQENDLFRNYLKKEIDINGIKVEGYFLNEDSKYVIIYAQDVDTGDTNYYSYNTKDHTTQVFNKEFIEGYENTLKNYKYVFLGLVVVIILLLFILIVRKPKKKKSKKKDSDVLVKTIEEHIDNEIKEEVKEIKIDDNQDNDNHEKELGNEEEVTLTKKEQKRLNKQAKKNKDFDFLMKLTSRDAYELLIKDVLNSEEELEYPKNRWVKHCINVGYAASIIADRLGVDADYAGALGIIHDIGRKISHPKHPIVGYQYMLENGYPEEAGICLTHSFVNNDIRLTAGEGPSGESLDLIMNYFNTHKLTIYDKIIQLCDLFCLDSHLTTIPDRLCDIYARKGVTEYSRMHIEAVLKLKEELERLMDCSLYDLFPEIDVKHIDEEQEKLNLVINR